ncbi:VanW family protein [Patescibacteria group bacterium]|nr:VanW family protein [Patescibacteria group bacterium]MBU2220161.1 VanW family protein [Patescibacteria group bacterium]MBU2264668.1 VanW family protein [Patescibacteria group bacterium]
MSYFLSLKKLFVAKKFWLLFLAIFLAGGIFFTALAAANHNQTAQGLMVAKIKIGGLNENELEEFLKNKIAEFNRQEITIVHGEKNWQMTPADFGLIIDLTATAQAALTFGQEAGANAFFQQTRALFFGQEIALNYSINSAKFKTALLLFSALEAPIQNAFFKYDPLSDEFIITPAQSGRVINRDQLIAGLLKTFAEPKQPINLVIDKAKPMVSEKEISQVADQAKKLADSAPYFLQSDAGTWRVDKSELANWLTVLFPADAPQTAQLSLNAIAIADFLTPLTASINREPLDAKLTWENGELKLAILAQNGVKLDIAASAQKISEDILANLPELDETSKKNIYLITTPIAPKISSQSLKELGLLTLLGQGESNFSGSPANRRHNIQTGATKLNGLLIKPGEEFSLSQNIGAIDAQNGWLPELVIKNNQTILEFGGGLCQVSTTLFRAAINAGLKITDRHPHAYPVHYYDPPGFDATVYPPSPDLKFLNSTPGNILLQSKIVGNKLFFDVYGTNEGREVKIKGPFVTQKNPDGSLKAILTQEIWQNGQLEQSNVFLSSYKSTALFPIATPTPTPTPTTTPSPTPLSAEATQDAFARAN